ncbi:MAG: rhomboid family intramembrane serine protease [Acidobacteria bacterium]|nr:rhomboid family intramembrane serine protease [Acidobacteriota bacterium]
MLFPIGDDNSQRQTTPVVTYALIGVNVLFFIYQTGHPAFTQGYSYVPAEITNGSDLVGTFNVGGGRIQLFPGPTPIYLTLLFAMFMHGGLMHIGGNMLYLWIFGDNVEDRMGRGRFLIFYLLTGLLASAAQIVVKPNSLIPNLGASGAIAGVLGGYLVLFPRQSVRVLMGRGIVEVPALIVIGLWGLMQFFGGFGQVSARGDSGGVAYMAHVGGFIAGIVLVFFFRDNQPRQQSRRSPEHDEWR